MIDDSLQPIAVNIREAAALLGVGRNTILNLAETGAIRSRKIFGRRVIDVASLRALMSETDKPSDFAENPRASRIPRKTCA